MIVAFACVPLSWSSFFSFLDGLPSIGLSLSRHGSSPYRPTYGGDRGLHLRSSRPCGEDSYEIGCGSRLPAVRPERTVPMPPITPTTTAPIAQPVPLRSKPKALSSDYAPAPTPASANTAAAINRLNS